MIAELKNFTKKARGGDSELFYLFNRVEMRSIKMGDEEKWRPAPGCPNLKRRSIINILFGIKGPNRAAGANF